MGSTTMGLKLREIWSDPTFLAAVAKMRAGEAVADQANGLGAASPRMGAVDAVADQADGPRFQTDTTSAASQDPKAGRQAEVTKRLAGLIGPYKEALSRNGPAAAHMQSQMAAVKKHIIERNFEQAAKDLDGLEPLAVQSKALPFNAVMPDGGTPLPSTTGVQSQTPFPQTPTMSAAPDKPTGGSGGGSGEPTGGGSGATGDNPADVQQMNNRMRELSAAEDEIGRELNAVNSVGSDLIEEVDLRDPQNPDKSTPSTKGKGPPNRTRTSPRPDRRLEDIGVTETRLRTIRDNPGTYGDAAARKAGGLLGQIGDLRNRQVDIEGERAALTTEINRRTGHHGRSLAPQKARQKPPGGGTSTAGGAGKPSSGGQGGGTQAPPEPRTSTGGPVQQPPTRMDSADRKNSTPPSEPQKGAEKLEAAASDARRRVDELKKRFTDHQHRQDKDHSRAEEAKLRQESETLLKEEEALESEVETLAKQLAEPVVGGVKGSNAKEILENARTKFESSSPTGGGVAGAVANLYMAYDVVLGIKHILEADSALEKLERTAEFGKDLAVGSAEFALVEYVTGISGAVAFALYKTVQTCGFDGGTACDAEQQKEKENERRKQTRAEGLAVGRFLEEKVPGSVRWNGEDDYLILDRKVWDETIKRLRRLTVAAPVRKLGVKDGITGTPSNQNAVEQGVFIDDDAQRQALEAYGAGYQEGEAKVRAALQRARELGMKDGKAGKPVHIDEIRTWPELSEVEGAAGMTLLHKLLDVYNAGLTAAAPAGVVPRAPSGTITAGEAVERDKKAAALKRAYQLGTKDGRAGKLVHYDQILTWPEVQTAGLTGADAAARMTLLREFQEAYNAAFAAVAPAPSAPATPAPSASSALTAGEAVERDKKAAALEHARALGMQDGKVGKTLHEPEILTWPEVQTAGLAGAEIAGRMILLQELQEAYNKAFAAAASATSAPRATAGAP